MKKESSSIREGFLRGARLYLLMAMIMAGLTAACGFDHDGNPPGAKCQVVPGGQARALKITAPSELILGHSAESRVGDYKLQNAKVAVVIKNPASSTAFLPFGGYPVDAVPADEQGCPLPDDHFGEMGTLVGNLDFSKPENISLRGFSPDAISIISDGSRGGNAVIRVRGTDVWIPIIETGILLLLPDKGFSVPMNLEVQTDYILAPDSNALEMVTTVVNPLDADSITVSCADGFLFGDGMTTRYPNAGVGDIAGYTVFTDIKFLTSSNGQFTYGYGLEDKHLMTSITIQAFTPALDQTPPIHLLPGESTTFSRRLVIMPGDANAMAQEFNPLWGITVEPFFGRVVTKNTGEPVPGAVVEILTRDLARTYVTEFSADQDGFFIGALSAGIYSAMVRAEARPSIGPIPLSQPFGYGQTFVMRAPGRIAYDVRDETGKNLPAKLTIFYQSGSIMNHIVTATGQGSELILPGTYNVAVSRGPEYTVSWWYNLLVPAGGEVKVRATLQRVVDTTGFVAADFHIHAEPSPDCDIPLSERIASCLAEGLEFVSSTDHEVVTDYRPTIQAMGVANLITAVFGEEVSSPVLGHFNAYSLDYNPLFRGNGALEWFLLSPQEIFDTLYARGAAIVQMNHPRDEEDGYLTAMLFNRSTGVNDELNPMRLGLLPGTTILSLEFNAMEIENGGSKNQIFFDPANPNETGALRDWFTLLNLGHRVTGVGNSDSHRLDRPPGFGRNMILSSTDDPGKLNPQELLDNLAHQRSIVSGGAFIRFTVDGTGLGETVTDTDGEVSLAIQVQSPPWADVTKVVVFANCSVVQTIDVTDQNPIVKYDGAITANILQDTWFVVMAIGDGNLSPVNPEFDATAPRAITNPIYVDWNGDGHFDAPLIIPCTSPY